MSKSLRQLCKCNLYNTADPPANCSKNKTRRGIPSKGIQSHGCDLAGQHPAVSPMPVVVALVVKGGHGRLPLPALLAVCWAPQTVTCWETCVCCPKARGGAGQSAGGCRMCHCCSCHPCWQRATAAPGLMEEHLFGEGAAWEGAERSNGDAISLEKAVPRGWSPATSPPPA